MFWILIPRLRCLYRMPRPVPVCAGWKSMADGMLAGDDYINATSPFRYVQFGELPEMPQTGDASNLWLWAGIALLGLLCAAGQGLRRRSRMN